MMQQASSERLKASEELEAMRTEQNGIIGRRLFVAGCVASLCPTVSFSASPDISNLIAAMTDNARAQVGINQLNNSPQLNRAAEKFAVILSRKGELSHTADGKTLAKRAMSTNYQFLTLAENIGWTSKTELPHDIASDLVRRWLASRGHRANMLNRKFNDIGVGVSQTSGRTYAVQIFGTRV